MPRLFVAIDLPDALKAKLAGLRDDALPGRWTPPHKYHLTLQFMGEVDEEGTATAEQALADLQADTFSVQGQGLGVFPSPRRPRVLFAALDSSPALLELQAQVGHALRANGFDIDPKPFRPHVTLARLRGATSPAVRAFLRTHQAFTIDPFGVNRYSLYESVLRPEGAFHTRRAMFERLR